jgi:hypothetical protein
VQGSLTCHIQQAVCSLTPISECAQALLREREEARRAAAAAVAVAAVHASVQVATQGADQPPLLPSTIPDTSSGVHGGSAASIGIGDGGKGAASRVGASENLSSVEGAAHAFTHTTPDTTAHTLNPSPAAPVLPSPRVSLSRPDLTASRPALAARPARPAPPSRPSAQTVATTSATTSTALHEPSTDSNLQPFSDVQLSPRSDTQQQHKTTPQAPDAHVTAAAAAALSPPEQPHHTTLVFKV